MKVIEWYWKKKYSINADVFSVRDTLHAAIFHCVSTSMPLSELEKEAFAATNTDEKDTPDKNKCNQGPIQTHTALGKKIHALGQTKLHFGLF